MSGPAAVSKDGQNFAFKAYDGTVCIRSVFGGHERNFHGRYNTSNVWLVEFSNDGQWIRLGMLRDVIILSINTGEEAESNTIAFDDGYDDIYKVCSRLIYKSGND